MNRDNPHRFGHFGQGPADSLGHSFDERGLKNLTLNIIVPNQVLHPLLLSIAGIRMELLRIRQEVTRLRIVLTPDPSARHLAVGVGPFSNKET